MKQQIKEVFEALQLLDMKPTPNNVSIMNGVFEMLRGIYARMEDDADAGTENAADPE